jgi:hypothetical protein
VLVKGLASRLRTVLGLVIYEEQSTFVRCCKILDGMITGNELVDDAHKLKKELILFKVDFEKAFDSVDCNYLDVVLSKMNFPILWRKWIKEVF